MLAAVVLLGGAGAAAGQSVAPDEDVIYVLLDGSRSRWCAYASKDRWAAKTEQVGPDMLGYLEYRHDRLQRINLRVAADTGDWIVDDSYTVDQIGQLVGLSRVIRYFSERELRSERFAIQGGKARLIEQSYKDVYTGRPLQLPRLNKTFDSWPMYLSKEGLPFVALLPRKAETKRAGEFCVVIRKPE